MAIRFQVNDCPHSRQTHWHSLTCDDVGERCTITNSIVSVTPIQGPVGLQFKMQYKNQLLPPVFALIVERQGYGTGISGARLRIH